ncbi:MAG TPA: ATP-binding protein [Ideonella sp.]|uniref:PAS domain-containing hybrid sensor histidine kinase/response regulator n=1 Tax=Ideonella sp. TaxID=1929293 RepID=UPI002E36F070|nr:ATP-binding protein [Ideonella sp.]HEX5685811.1 ATP-binding protein [Ideonella sp.]
MNPRPSKGRCDTLSKASAGRAPPVPDALRLLHELQVHQAELAQQNEELKSARDDLESSAQRYFDLYESAPVGLVTLSRQGIVREVNRYGRELLDDDSDSLEGTCLLDRLTGPSRAGLAEALAAREPGSASASIEVSVRARANDARILQAKVRPHSAGSDNMLLALTDVTEQRRSEAELAYTREILELSNRVARIGYWQVDLDTGAMNWSAVAREIYELPVARGQTLAKTIDCCKDDAGRETLRHALAAAVAYGTTFDLELQIATPAGRDRWIRITGRADAAGSSHRRLYGTVQDIDAHFEAESARVAQAGAELANRSKTAFLARMSHDLRTPLNAVIGFSELLQLNRAAMSTPTVATQVRHIHRAGKHLLALIDEVLDLARIESGDLHIVLEPVPLGALLDECMTIAAPMAAERALTLRTPACPADASVLGDRTRLLQVLLNLLSNAVKYNREGGEVAIELGGDDDHVTIAVRDTGEGLTPEQLGQLFQPFNRLGAELRGIEGTGLGLVIAKQLVEAMGGQLEAQSTVGTGSVFTMRLRGSATGRTELARRPGEASLRESEPDAHPFVVLYVEDNPVNVEVMRAALAMRDHVKVEVAVDGQAGLDMARHLRPDLILLDMGLPLMDGPTVFAHLHADPALAQIPCVAVSANAMDADIKQALDSGFADYIVKPFALPRLLSMLDRMMAARPATSQTTRSAT